MWRDILRLMRAELPALLVGMVVVIILIGQ